MKNFVVDGNNVEEVGEVAKLAIITHEKVMAPHLLRQLHTVERARGQM